MGIVACSMVVLSLPTEVIMDRLRWLFRETSATLGSFDPAAETPRHYILYVSRLVQTESELPSHRAEVGASTPLRSSGPVRACSLEAAVP